MTATAVLLAVYARAEDKADVEAPGSEEEAAVAVFNETISKHGLVLVEFSHKDDENAQKLGVQSQAAADRLGMFLMFLRVDCASAPSLQSTYNITTYPTIMLFSQGQRAVYDGPMVAEDIVLYGVSAYQQIRAMLEQKAESSAQPPVPELRVLSTTVQTLRFVEIHDVAVIGFFDNEESAQGFASFAAKASQDRADIGIAAVTEPSTRTAFKVKDTPRVVMFKRDEPTVTFTGNCSDAAKLAAWASMHGTIQVRQLDAQKFSEISSSEIPVVLLFFQETDKGMEMKKMLQELAPEFLDVLTFYLVNGPQFPTITKQFGIPHEGERAVVLYPPKGYHYVMPANRSLTIDNLRDYLNEYLADGVQRTLRSEPIPPKPFTRGAVQTAVTSTMMEIINDSKHDVLMEFCKPGLEDCTTLSVVTDQVAKVAENITTFKVARINVEANEVSAYFELPHIPLLLLFRASNKTGISYNGVATPLQILQFASNHSSTEPFAIPDKLLAEDNSATTSEEEEQKAQEEHSKIEDMAVAHVTSTLHAMQANAM